MHTLTALSRTRVTRPKVPEPRTATGARFSNRTVLRARAVGVEEEVGVEDPGVDDAPDRSPPLFRARMACTGSSKRMRSDKMQRTWTRKSGTAGDKYVG